MRVITVLISCTLWYNLKQQNSLQYKHGVVWSNNTCNHGEFEYKLWCVMPESVSSSDAKLID